MLAELRHSALYELNEWAESSRERVGCSIGEEEYSSYARSNF